VTPAEALGAYRSHPKLGGVLAACHPARSGTAVTVADSADPDLVGLVTCAAIAAGMDVVVIAVGAGTWHLRAVRQVENVARALGTSVALAIHEFSTTCMFDREQVPA
jgi:hypothetical protein